MSDDDMDKMVPTPRGIGRSMQSLKPDTINITYGDTQSPPGTGADWFGPRQPMHPIAPPEVAGRSWDYISGYNLATFPRAYEEIDFKTLRMLASSYDPVRLIIERRKDQLCRVPWTIRVKHEGAKRPGSSALSPQTRGLIKDVTEFFKYPAANLSYRSWLRMLLDDVLILDAPSLFCERDSIGNLVALSPIDGATIKPVIDERGRLPRAFKWDGRPFEWNGVSVTTANYEDIGCKIADGLMYVPAFQQNLHGLPAVNYTIWDLIYRPMNLRTHGVYGMSPVQQIITTVSIAMRRSFAQLEYFREGNQPDAVFGLPESWTPDKVQQFQDYWDSIYSGNFANRRKMKFIPSGSNSRYTALKEPPLKSEFDEWLVRIVCFAFSYPPAAFVALSNRSIAEQHEKQAEEEGVEPLKQWAAETFNEIISREFSEEIEFAWTEEEVVDQKVQSEILSTYVQSGILTINQAREKIGEEPDSDPAANKLLVKTATGFTPIGRETQRKNDNG
jgi:HK97 family phage portal protein